jgi:hypothetical protein
VSAIGDLSAAPADFLTALAALRRANCRNELKLAELPAPSRLAPYAVALGAEVIQPSAAGPRPAHGPVIAALRETEDVELAAGRFILLHDPDGSAVWDGTFRIVTYIRAELDADMGNDALLGSVAWTWLVDALHDHGARYRNAGGTATRILSESFGSLSDNQDAIDIELRASWTPDSADLQSHLEAWSDMVCTFAGLPPLPEGVTSLPNRRRN